MTCPACLQDKQVTIPFRSLSVVAMANHIRTTYDKLHVETARQMGNAMHDAANIALTDWVEGHCK